MGGKYVGAPFLTPSRDWCKTPPVCLVTQLTINCLRSCTHSTFVVGLKSTNSCARSRGRRPVMVFAPAPRPPPLALPHASRSPPPCSRRPSCPRPPGRPTGGSSSWRPAGLASHRTFVSFFPPMPLAGRPLFPCLASPFPLPRAPPATLLHGKGGRARLREPLHLYSFFMCLCAALGSHSLLRPPLAPFLLPACPCPPIPSFPLLSCILPVRFHFFRARTLPPFHL